LCEFVPKHISSVIGGVEAIISSTCELDTVYMFYYWIDLVILSVEDILVVNVGSVHKDQLYSLLFRFITNRIVELTGDELSICMLYKDNH
jgi:hypothetical protein